MPVLQCWFFHQHWNLALMSAICVHARTHANQPNHLVLQHLLK
uniref:Uncharacterized protein n=1 Tax=Anguilla anguilla TaxID=7936 RepID=A0A0E9UUR9_ANGAN